MKFCLNLLKTILSFSLAMCLIIPAPVEAALVNREQVIFEGISESGTLCTQNGVSFTAVASNANIAVSNTGGAIVASASNSLASGDYCRFSLGYPVTSAVGGCIVAYEYKLKFSGSLPSKLSFDSRDTKGAWTIVQSIATSKFSAGTEYLITLYYYTATAKYVVEVKNASDSSVVQSDTGATASGASTGVQAPYLEWHPKDATSQIHITNAKVAFVSSFYKENEANLIFDGIPQSGTSFTQNGASFSATANNSHITIANTSGTVVASATDSFASGDYVRFALGYPVTSATHSGTVTYEYAVKFSGSVPGAIHLESYHTKNTWAFSQAIDVSFMTDTDYIIALSYDISTAAYTITAKEASGLAPGLPKTYSGTASGGPLAGLQAPYLQWKPSNASSKVHITNATITYTGHFYTLHGSTLIPSGETMAANVNIYKAMTHSPLSDDATLVVAEYGDANELISVTCRDFSLTFGDNALQLVLNQPISNVYRSRIFLWSDAGSHQIPLTSSASFTDGQSEADQSIMNMDYMVENFYLKDCTVFMLSSDYMYSCDTKQTYPSDSPKPIELSGTYMIPAGLLESVCGYNVSFNKATGAININNKAELSLDSTVMTVSSQSYTLTQAPTLVSGELYLPFASLMTDGLGKGVYCDERGMLILSDSALSHSDSAYFLDVFEPVDHIWRYMQYDNPTGDSMLADVQSTIANAHPRLTMTSAQRDYIIGKIASADPRWIQARDTSVVNANAVISSNRVVSSAPAHSSKQGAAAQYAADMKQLSMAYLLTQDAKYAECALANLEAAISWDNLGESLSQLTMGDWAYGTALGIDTFYDYMQASNDGKELFARVKTAVKLLLLDNLTAQYKGTGGNCRWVKMTDNFVGVVGGGTMMLLLSLAGESDLYTDCAYLMENVYKSLQLPLGLFGPDGGWYEGVSYGNYCLTNIADALVALRNSCGTLYGLDKSPGFDKIPDFYLYMSTPNASFNFHDMPPRHENALKAFSIAYLADDAPRMEALKRHRELSGEDFDITSLMFYDKCITDKGNSVNLDSLPLDRYFRIAGAGGFLSSLTDATPTFVGFHGGRSGLVHDSLDLGEFYFEADGVVWAYDLGSDNYSLPSYFVIPDGYRHYRKNPQGENVLLINPQADSSSYYGQKVGAYAELVEYESSSSGAKAAYDLTEAYERDVSSYRRGYIFGDNRSTLTVSDELTLKNNSNEIYWFMHTPASIEIVDNTTAILTKGGKQCRVELTCSNASFELKDMDAKLLDGSPGKAEENLGNSNAHVRKLAIHFTNVPKGELNISVKLIPQNVSDVD